MNTYDHNVNLRVSQETRKAMKLVAGEKPLSAVFRPLIESIVQQNIEQAKSEGIADADLPAYFASRRITSVPLTGTVQTIRIDRGEAN